MAAWRKSRSSLYRANPCAAVCLAILPCLLGCGDKLTSVSGSVRLDGKPIGGAAVALHPVHGGPLVGGITDDTGQFSLEAGKHLTVAPGEYRVTVVKKNTTGFLRDESGLSVGIAPGGIKEEWLTPKKYANPTESDLKVEVTPGMGPLTLELTTR